MDGWAGSSLRWWNPQALRTSNVSVLAVLRVFKTIPLRLLGLFLLSLAILIPGCQAVFARDAADGKTPFTSGYVRD
jgi:hypothetical protein